MLLQLLTRYARYSISLPLKSMLLRALAKGRAERKFHNEHASEDNDGCEEGVGILMERGVLQVVVVEGYEDCEGDEAEGKGDAEG